MIVFNIIIVIFLIIIFSSMVTFNLNVMKLSKYNNYHYFSKLNFYMVLFFGIFIIKNKKLKNKIKNNSEENYQKYFINWYETSLFNNRKDNSRYDIYIKYLRNVKIKKIIKNKGR